MRALVLNSPGPLDESRLELRDLPVPDPGPGQVLIEVHANAVCRTDLHVVEGDLPAAKPGVIPGHQIVGTVQARGEGVSGLAEGDRVGIPWLGGNRAHVNAGADHHSALAHGPERERYQIAGRSELLWNERVLRSVANLTRRDGQEFLMLAPRIRVSTETEIFPLERTYEALLRVKEGNLRGAAVVVSRYRNKSSASSRRSAFAPGPSASVT